MITIDFLYLIQILVPPFYKGMGYLIYLQCIVKPIQTLHGVFHQFFAEKEYELNWNGQVMSLEGVLNTEFDSELRRIYIDDPGEEFTVYLFNKDEENEATFIYNKDEIAPETYLRNLSEEPVDFLIIIPVGLEYDPHRFNAIVKKYKIASKTYNLIEE